MFQQTSQYFEETDTAKRLGVTLCFRWLLAAWLLFSLSASCAKAQVTIEQPSLSDQVLITLPAGDPEVGKRVFVERLCHACHTVSDDPDFRVLGELVNGPDLALSSVKNAGFLATSIIAPDHQVSSSNPDQLDIDGRSLMPSINETLTVLELLDLIAYLTSKGDTP